MATITRRQVFIAALAFGGAGALAIAEGCGNGGVPPGGMTQIFVKAAATGLDTPLDATPDPKNQTIYFLATGANGKGVFSVPAGGGDTTEVHAGDPLVDPRGIAIGIGGKTLYVADRAAGGKGGIYALPVGGGMPTPIAGTEGLEPSALDVVDAKGADKLYFTGVDAGGQPAVFTIPAAGGTATVLAGGAPMGRPGGVAAALDGSVYVTDEAPAGGGEGRVFKIAGGKVTTLVSDLVAGSPAGTALSLDESALLVSSVDAAQGTSQVLIVDLATSKTTTFSDVIKQNDVSGGVHRAYASNDFAWAGYKTVYSIGVKRVLFEGSTPGGPGD